MRLKAISLWQPWASLMAENAKMIETRHWPTTYRGLLAIHAATKWNKDLELLSLSNPFRKSLCLFDDEKLPRGAIVAVGNLNKCLAMDEYPNLLPAEDSHERAFGNYGPGRWMWVFDQVWKLSSPVYVRGRQNFWTLNEAETDTVMTLMPDGWEESINE